MPVSESPIDEPLAHTAPPVSAELPPSSLEPPLDASPSVPSAPDSFPLRPSGRIPPSRPSLSLPPLPAVEPILDQAADARERGDWESALEAYKKALFVVDPNDAAANASIYAYLGEVKRAQGKLREAESNFEKALGKKPGHLRSLDALIAIAIESEDWERVVTFRRKRADAFDDEDDRVGELCKVADVYETKLRNPKRAAEALETAGLLRPGDVGILLKLRDLYASLKAFPKILDVLDELCRASSEPRHRGTYRFQQADVVLGRLRDEPRGLAFLELALDEDPQNDPALSALIAVRSRREEWAELAAVYETLIDRFAGLGDRERAWEVCRKLATLRRDRLLDGPGALEAFRGALELRPDDAESRASLAELYAAKGDRSAAVRELETAAVHAPLRAQTYRRLFDLHQRAQRLDRTWLVATCLEELGAADVGHELVIEQYRIAGPIRPVTALDEAGWAELLHPGAADPVVGAVLRAIEGAAIALRIEELTAAKKLPTLPADGKQDPASTASVVRTFMWAGRALGVSVPNLYLLDDVPSGVAAVPSVLPATALGPQVRSGMSVQELAFVAGRHLTYYRPEHYPLVFFPTLAELSALVLSAVRVVIPSIVVPLPPEGEGRVHRELGARLGEGGRKALEAAVAQLDARGGKLDLLAWIRGVELTAARAGLLLAGDLRVPMRMTKDEARPIGELSPEAKRGDLLAFCASDRYGKLRDRLGVARVAQTSEAD